MNIKLLAVVKPPPAIYHKMTIFEFGYRLVPFGHFVLGFTHYIHMFWVCGSNIEKLASVLACI